MLLFLLVCKAVSVSVSVRLFVPWHEERYKGPRDTTPGLCRMDYGLPARHGVGIDGASCWSC